MPLLLASYCRVRLGHFALDGGGDGVCVWGLTSCRHYPPRRGGWGVLQQSGRRVALPPQPAPPQPREPPRPKRRRGEKFIPG